MAKLLDTNSLSGVFHEIKQAIAGAFDNLTYEQKMEIKGDTGATGATGPQGPQGDSVIVGEGDLPLANYVSQANDKAVTPKAVYDELQKVDRKIDYGEAIAEVNVFPADDGWTEGKYYATDGKAKKSSGWKARADIPVIGYDFVRVSSCNISPNACIIFADGNGYIEGTCIPGSGTNTPPYYDELIVKVPEGATRLGMSAMIDEETYGSPYCYGIRTEGGIKNIAEIKSEIDALIHGRTYSIREGIWRDGVINAAGNVVANTDFCLSNEYVPTKNLRRIRKLQEPENKISVVCYGDKYSSSRLGNFNYFSSDFTKLPMECNYVRLFFSHNDRTDANDYIEVSYWDGGVEERIEKVESIAGTVQRGTLLSSMGAKTMDLLFKESTIIFTSEDARPGEYVDFKFRVNADSPSGKYAYIELLDENGQRLNDPGGLGSSGTCAYGKIKSSSTESEYTGWMEIPEGFAKARLYMSGTTVTLLSLGKYHHERLEDYSFVCNRIDSLSFDEPYTKILASDDEDASGYEDYSMSLGNVLKISDGMYYLYYYGQGKRDDHSSDARGHILFAHSTDGFNWVRGFPQGVEPPISGEGKECLVFEEKIAEQQMFKVPDNEYPYRMVAGHSKFGADGDYIKNMTSFWKSRDAIHWEYVRKIYNRCYDSQYCCIVRGSYIKCYMRTRSQGNPNPGARYVGVMTLDLDGNMVSPPTTIGLRLYYNTAATALDERRDILFPTYYVPATNAEHLSCFIIDGDKARKVDVDFSNLLEEKDKQMYFMPGIINIGEDFYIFYLTRDEVHSPDPEDSSGGQGVSEMRMAKLTFATTGKPLRIRNKEDE